MITAVIILAVALVFVSAKWITLLRKKQSRRTELRFHKASPDEYDRAVAWARRQMTETGWTLDSYVDDWKDCTNYAKRMVTLIDEWFYANRPTHSGHEIGAETFSFDRKDGKGHVVIECNTSQGSVFYDCYAESVGRLTLTKKEIKSAQWKNFEHG